MLILHFLTVRQTTAVGAGRRTNLDGTEKSSQVNQGKMRHKAGTREGESRVVLHP
jgi:hypothetical protein